MNNPTIEINIADILKDLQSGQKEIQKEISDLKVNLETVKGDVNVLKGEINNVKTEVREVKEDIKELKKSQQKIIVDIADLKGAKSLIVPAFVAVLASVVTVTLKAILFN